jgi:hypothetical protein
LAERARQTERNLEAGMCSKTAHKRAEREASNAARAAREAERKRQWRNEEARERRAAWKAAAERERELSKLIGALGLLASPFDGERAAAALQVERLRARMGKRWRELIRG